MKIQNNKKTKITTTIIAALVIGLIMSSPMTVLSNVNAQIQSVSSTHGRNIVLDQPSSTQVPVQKQLRDELMTKLKVAQSESSKAEISSELGKIDVSVQQWFKDHENPTKEKIVREKQDVLDDVLAGKATDTGLHLTQNLPWSVVTYDYADNALEVSIVPQYFNSTTIPKYFEMIRSIVGDQIDVALSPQNYPQTTTCTGYTATCSPMEGAIQYGPSGCSIMYAATYNSQKGFVSAGHCVSASQSITQPSGGSTVGSVVATKYVNNTNCDCSFIANNTSRNINNQVLGYTPTPNNTAPPFVGMSVTMCGTGTLGCSSGSVVGIHVQIKDMTTHIIVKDTIESSYTSIGGDSGGPVISGTALVGVQSSHNTMTGHSFASPVGDIVSSPNFSGLTWCFSC